MHCMAAACVSRASGHEPFVCDCDRFLTIATLPSSRFYHRSCNQHMAALARCASQVWNTTVNIQYVKCEPRESDFLAARSQQTETADPYTLTAVSPLAMIVNEFTTPVPGYSISQVEMLYINLNSPPVFLAPANGPIQSWTDFTDKCKSSVNCTVAGADTNGAMHLTVLHTKKVGRFQWITS